MINCIQGESYNNNDQEMKKQNGKSYNNQEMKKF